MVYFQTKNPTLGKFWSALEWKMLVYFIFMIYYGHLVYLMTIWKFMGILVYPPHFGILYHEKSGNPGQQSKAESLKNSKTTEILPFLSLQRLLRNSPFPDDELKTIPRVNGFCED
jgi:hypothetical protein